MNYKRKVKLKLAHDHDRDHNRDHNDDGRRNGAGSGTTADIAGLLLEAAEVHRAEAERFEKAARILRDPVEVGEGAVGDADTQAEIERKRTIWRESARRQRARQAALKAGGALKAAGNGPRSYWAAMTPEQRSREMKRRQKVARGLIPRTGSRAQVVRMPMGGVA